MRTEFYAEIRHTYYTKEEFAELVDNPSNVIQWCESKMAYLVGKYDREEDVTREDFDWPELSERDKTFVTVAVALAQTDSDYGNLTGEILVKQWNNYDDGESEAIRP